MGSIGGGNGATTTFNGNTMNTRVSAGNQLDSLGGGDDWDPYALIKRLRADKETARRSAAEWDAKQAQKAQWKDTALSVAPKDAHGEAMGAARTQADVYDFLQGRKEAAIERTRQDMLYRTDNDPSSMPVRGMGSYRSFGHQMPAAAMHGVDIMAGNPTGWEMYAALAGAPQSAAAVTQAGENNRANNVESRLQTMNNQGLV